MPKRVFALVTVAALIAPAISRANECTSIRDKVNRLACYDRQASKTSQPDRPCQDFEERSNALIDRFAIGFSDQGQFQPLAADLFSAYTKCESRSKGAHHMQSYSINMQAFLVINEVWRRGMEECNRHLTGVTAQISGIRSCAWQDMYNGAFMNQLKEKFPILESVQEWKFGPVNQKMLQMVRKF